MTYGSLFAGCGGFDLGLDMAGLGPCRWQVELDKDCRRVLARHWPEAKRYDDVRVVGKHNLAPVDIICGGFPCQDLSVAGKRAGIVDGARSGLFYEMVRIVYELKPSYVLFENVFGLLSSDDGRDFLRVLCEMDKLGYCGAWSVFDSQYFGVAQRRVRVFGLFARGDIGTDGLGEIFLISDGLSWNPAPRRGKGQGVAAYTQGSIGGYREGCGTLRASGGDNGGGSEVLIVPEVSLCLGAHGGQHLNPTVETFPIYAIQQNASGEVRSGEIAYTLNQNSNASGRNTGMVMTIRTANTGANGIGVDESGIGYTLDGSQVQAVAYGISNQPTPKIGEDVCPSLDAKEKGGGRMECVCYENHGQDSRIKDCGDLSPTISTQAGTGGNNLPLVMAFAQNSRDEVREMEVAGVLGVEPGMHQTSYIRNAMALRRLTPRETERLQGFQFRCAPDYPGAWQDELGRWWSPDWTDQDADGKPISDHARYRMMGNAVTVNVVRWIGERIKRFHENREG